MKQGDEDHASEMVPQEDYQKLKDAFNEFTYTVSHDLNAPLRHIRSFTMLLLDRLKPHMGVEEEQFASIIERAVSKSEAMIEALLELSRLNTTAKPFEAVDCNDVVRDIIDNVLALPISESGAQIDVDPLPTIQADEVQIRQLFYHVMDNALKFQAAGNKPHIRVHAQALAEGGWEFLIDDNGIGVEKGFEIEMFKLFKALYDDKDYPGIGMGLTLCEAIAQHHGGLIECRSNKPQGSSFRIVLN